VAVRLTDVTSLHFARNASGHPFVFAVDHVAGTVGTSVLMVASNQTVDQAFVITPTKVFVKLNGGNNCFNVSVVGTTCTVSTFADAAIFASSTFTGAPLICALGINNDLFVALDTDGVTTVRAQAVDCSGANPVAGASVNVSALGTGSVATIGIYRITATTAMALYIDDSGVAGAPYSIRGVVLSLSGTTITVNTSAGVNDVANLTTLPSCQLSATSYVVGFYQTSGTLARAVAVTVSGTTTTFGTPLTVETIDAGISFSANLANRFNPNLYALSGTTALFTYLSSTLTTPSRHVVLTNNAGTLSAGVVLYGLWYDSGGGASGGNFPQASDGFLTYMSATDAQRVTAVSVAGSVLTVGGTFSDNGKSMRGNSTTQRFGLSGGVRGIFQSTGFGGTIRPTLALFRFGANGPRYLGDFTINNHDVSGQTIPVEVTPSKAAFIGTTYTQSGSTSSSIKFTILEFPA
jgi:hypothetical protein